MLTWIVELEGDFESLSRVIEWFETAAADSMDRILFEGKHGRLTLSLVVRGLAWTAAPKNSAKDGAKTPDKAGRNAGRKAHATLATTADGEGAQP